MRIVFITIEQLLEMKENGDKFKLVEVLPQENYKSGHIPGAINVPVNKLPGSLKKTDKIVVYCRAYSCGASTMAAKTLLKLGFKNVLDYKAGKEGWVSSGLELEK